MFWEILDFAKALKQSSDIEDFLRLLATIENKAKLELAEKILNELKEKGPQFLEIYLEHLITELYETKYWLESQDPTNILWQLL